MDNQPLQQHARDLLLDKLGRRALEEREQEERKVVRVVVRVPQLVHDAVQEQVPLLRIQVGRKCLRSSPVSVTHTHTHTHTRTRTHAHTHTQAGSRARHAACAHLENVERGGVAKARVRGRTLS